jgi:hypothetical protein
LISTKEKSLEKLTALFSHYFLIKKASAHMTQRPTRKETYIAPLRFSDNIQEFSLPGSAGKWGDSSDIQVATAHYRADLACFICPTPIKV